jgi:hypothetical protein
MMNQNTDKKVCKWGHDISTPESVYRNGNRRECKKCKKRRNNECYALKKARLEATDAS